jgi:aromatic-L-amino-acid/L-tryptophan decarboxylase
MLKDQAETGNLQALLSQIGTGLDQFLKFEHEDALHKDKVWRENLDISLPEKGVGIEQVIQDLNNEIIPNGSAVPKPGFTSYITTGAVTASTLATTAASIASPQRNIASAFNFLEELSLRWLAEMCGIADLRGVYSSGGSVANLVALGAARQYAFEKVNHDVAAEGVDRPVGVYASEECHHTIQRSGGVLGIGRRAVRSIACDNAGRMQMKDLIAALAEDEEKGILPVAIVANAGSTNTGAIDPLRAIGELAKEKGIWYHVDGAYGLPGILDERLSDLYQGLELADSVIVDPHKWLGASVGVAATFVRDRDLLQRAFTQEPADYLEGSIDQSGDPEAGVKHSLDDFGIPYFDYGVELSSPCRGIVVWAMIREIGVEGMRNRIKRHNDIARYIADFSRQHLNLELLLEPTLSICCFRYVDSTISDLNQLNQTLHRRLVRENEFMPSTTRIDGNLALRPCYIGARHEQQQAEGLLQAVLRIGKELVEAQTISH